jgi:hypothetical protein
VGGDTGESALGCAADVSTAEDPVGWGWLVGKRVGGVFWGWRQMAGILLRF